MAELHQPQTRMTQQRTVILEELRKLKTHPTADELYHIVRHRLPKISLGTVYRNLVFLTESGQITRLESAGSINRFDANIEPHQHVRCVGCGCVADVHPSMPAPSPDQVSVPGFARVLQARVEFDGLCEECAARCENGRTSAVIFHGASD